MSVVPQSQFRNTSMFMYMDEAAYAFVATSLAHVLFSALAMHEENRTCARLPFDERDEVESFSEVWLVALPSD